MDKIHKIGNHPIAQYSYGFFTACVLIAIIGSIIFMQNVAQARNVDVDKQLSILTSTPKPMQVLEAQEIYLTPTPLPPVIVSYKPWFHVTSASDETITGYYEDTHFCICTAK